MINVPILFLQNMISMRFVDIQIKINAALYWLEFIIYRTMGEDVDDTIK